MMVVIKCKIPPKAILDTTYMSTVNRNLYDARKQVFTVHTQKLHIFSFYCFLSCNVKHI